MEILLLFITIIDSEGEKGEFIQQMKVTVTVFGITERRDETGKWLSMQLEKSHQYFMPTGEHQKCFEELNG